MNQAPNLMPRSWIDARRRASRRRLCAWVVGPVMVISLGLIGWSQWRIAQMDARAAGRQDDAADRRAALVAELVSLRDRHEAAVRARSAEGLLSRQPDWSLLLALVSDACGDEATLRSLRLERDDDGSTLDLEGDAGAAVEATGLALRLEASGLFESVRLGEVARLDESRVRFEITARLVPEGPGIESAGAGEGP